MTHATMPVVYIAGPYRAATPWEVEQNVRFAEEQGLAVAQVGAMPVIPHTMTRFFDRAPGVDDALWLPGTLELMCRCDAVLMIPGWSRSVGATSEREEAIRRGLPVFTSAREVAAFVEEWGKR